MRLIFFTGMSAKKYYSCELWKETLSHIKQTMLLLHWKNYVNWYKDNELKEIKFHPKWWHGIKADRISNDLQDKLMGNIPRQATK